MDVPDLAFDSACDTDRSASTKFILICFSNHKSDKFVFAAQRFVSNRLPLPALVTNCLMKRGAAAPIINRMITAQLQATNSDFGSNAELYPRQSRKP